jgi:hypothetical protein
MRTVLNLPGPTFDTGQYEGAEFLMRGGDASLTITFSGRPNATILFRRVRWHQFTALYNCSPEQVHAYFKLVEVDPSQSLAAYVKADRASAKAYKELHHYRIFLDETGCHEVFAESVHA